MKKTPQVERTTVRDIVERWAQKTYEALDTDDVEDLVKLLETHVEDECSHHADQVVMETNEY